jgi:hypothetical protein
MIKIMILEDILKIIYNAPSRTILDDSTDDPFNND